jgi:hypothetical protein
LNALAPLEPVRRAKDSPKADEEIRRHEY